MTECLAISSSTRYQWTYDVFLNFKGKDTRYGFTGSLYNALNKNGVRTFFDDNEIRKGDEITPTLLKAIQESRMAIVVFSKEYAYSKFCLNELVQIYECIMRDGRKVWPIFYGVEPSDVRYQRETYGQALDKHEQNSRADEEKMKNWKQALRKVADLSGSTHDPSKKYDHELIDEIVKNILRIIKRGPLTVAEYPVGLTSRVEKINSLLQLGSNDNVFMIGICGIGGMGKTTIARAVYNAIADHFDYLCFLDDIKGESVKHGLQQQQVKMFSKLSLHKIEIEDINEGVELIKRTLKGKKTLLILDNLDERKQLQKLSGTCEWFGCGSRIIITTRDLHLLEIHGVERIYDMERLNHKESLELLSWMAFGKKEVYYDSRYKNVVERVISYASGLPLALELIGSDLYGKNVREWESMLNERKRTPHDKIQQILKVSYDGLQQPEKEAFLDIACFYNGRGLEYVKKMVGIVHDFDPADYHIRVLVDKCLIKIEEHFSMQECYCIKMHDLVQDMGREIVHQESRKDVGNRSRLWSSKDICRILEESEGTSEVIIINQVESSKSIKIDWDAKAFKSMKNLKLLILENAKFSQGPKYLPSSLAVLRWRGYPSSSLPDGFRPKDLVEFDVRDSNFNSIMETVSKMILLKSNVSVLNFSGCKYIEKIPNLSGLPSLKVLRFSKCTNLIEIDNSVGQLAKLETLDVSGCAQLRTFPSELNTPSLIHLYLRGSLNLTFFPKIVTREMKISFFYLDGTGIDQLPPSFENLTKLISVEIKTYSRVRSMKLPSSTFLLPALDRIAVEGCEVIMEVESIIYPNIWFLELQKCNISNENLQIYLAAFSNVRALDLRGSDFTILPACIEDCPYLSRLVLEECKHLIEVEKVPPSITRLSAGDCTSLSSESRKLLLSKELLTSVVPINNEYSLIGEAHFCVPGGSIPEWFDHCSKGPSISFWFFDQRFPTHLIICVILERSMYDDVDIQSEVFINEEACTIGYLIQSATYDEELIVVDYILEVDMEDKSYAQGQWKHAKICFSGADVTTGAVKVKESGIYVIRDWRTNMENIRFTDPFQCSDNNQGCTIEGDTTATNNPSSPSQSERQHTHSHAVLDIDGLRRLSQACRTQRLAFPVSVHMEPGIVGSKLEYDIIITKQHVMEFLSMQELCITIIQVFVMFANSLCRHREIDDRFGFLCPNAVQSVGHMREDRISYIGSTIKEGNKQCWLAPILEGNHWTLCAICPESNIIYWFDSLGREQSNDIEKIFTEALQIFHIIGETNTKWLRPNYRRQLGDKECGYYVMRYLYDIIDLNQVHLLDTHFNNPQCYSQEDIDNIRNMWSLYFMRHAGRWTMEILDE